MLDGQPPACGKQAHARILKALAKRDPELPQIARETIEAVQHRVIEAFVTAESLQGINLGDR